MYTAISMGIIIVILMVVLLIVTALLILVTIRAKCTMNRMFAESRVYDEIVTFDATKNVAYMKHQMRQRE